MVSTDIAYEINFEFFKNYLNCHYHCFEGYLINTKSVQIDYPKILDIIQSDTLILDKYIRTIEISFCDASCEKSSTEQTVVSSLINYKINANEIQAIVSYIIKNATADELFINIKYIAFNLSQMRPYMYLTIADYEGILPPEYLQHLVKLLENGQTNYVTFIYNKNMSIEEDLLVFDNISFEISILSPVNTKAYRIKLKE